MKYECHTCGSQNCKLWRESHCYSKDPIPLKCWKCLEDFGHTINLSLTDQVHDSELNDVNWVPAVPYDEDSYWGYTSVPENRVQWWKNLPDKPFSETKKEKPKIGAWDVDFLLGEWYLGFGKLRLHTPSGWWSLYTLFIWKFAFSIHLPFKDKK